MLPAAAQFSHQRQHDLAHSNRIFTRLDVNVCNCCGSLVNNQLRKFVRGQSVALQGAVVAAHRAITAIFAAVARYLDDTAHKDPSSKHFITQRPGLLVRGWECHVKCDPCAR
jgi:hypothetical protein